MEISDYGGESRNIFYLIFFEKVNPQFILGNSRTGFTNVTLKIEMCTT